MNNQRPQSNTCEMWMNTVSVCWFEDVAEHKSLSESYQEQWWTCCVANLTRWTCKPRTFSSFNSQIWQCGRCSQQARWDEEPERSLAPSQESVPECFCKNSWPQRCRDEQWGQIMEIPTMWTFNCFQRQLAVKREHLTSSPFTNASLLWEHYPLLVFPSLLYIIKWPTACSLQQTIEPALFFHPQIYWFISSGSLTLFSSTASVKLSKPVWQWRQLCSPRYLCSKQGQTRQTWDPPADGNSLPNGTKCSR